MPEPTVPQTEPHLVGADTWLITNLAPGPDAFVPVNSMVIRGAEPVVVDTGAPVHRDNWFRQVFSLVEPEDVRWIYLSHDDGDHAGNLRELLDRCPNATLVANFFATERLSLEWPVPITRMRWLGPGDTLDAGDRKLHLIVPPIFDGPTTRALYDERTAILWAVDSFAAMTPGALHERADIPDDLYEATFHAFNSMISPWHQWLDPARYRAHTERVEGLGLLAVASAHGPVLRGSAIHDAFERVRAIAGRPIFQPPGQELLDELIAAALAAMVTTADAA